MRLISIFFDKKYDYLLIIIVGILLFSFLINFVDTDIQVHNEKINQINIGTRDYPVHLLYFFIVNILSFFSNNKILISISSVTVLTSFVLLKYLITKYILSDYSKNSNFKISDTKISLISSALLLFFSIPDAYQWFSFNRMYIGKIPPTVWHNSTTIVLFPFALLLFYKQYQSIISKKPLRWTSILVTSLLVLLNAFAKPSFLLVYIPVTSFFLIKNIGKEQLCTILIKLMPIILGTVIVSSYFVILYILGGNDLNEPTHSISLSIPFEVYTKRTPIFYFPFSLILTFTFPITFYLLYPNQLYTTLTKYSLSLTVLGILISKVVIENGPRKFDGNFYWQNVICCYLMVIVTLMSLFSQSQKKAISRRNKKILSFVFSIHVVSGIVYLLKIFLTRKYQ